MAKCLSSIVWQLRYAVALIISLFIFEPSFAQQMVYPADEWETAAPESVLVDSEALQAALNTLNNTDEMIVARNGRVIWMGDNVHESQHVYSVTKSFASTVLGLLIDDGAVTLDTPASELVPALAEDYSDATLRHFVTHTSGYRGSTFNPGSPLFSPPGSQFLYNNSFDMMTNAMTRAAGEPLQKLFTRRISDPIQMNPGEWDWNEFVGNDGVVVDGGAGSLGRGVVTSAENAARLGHLFLNRGVWNEAQLISSDWVDAATQVQVASMPIHPESDVNAGPGQYGFGWWVLGSSWYDAIGFSNNYISVDPEAGFVVASLGTVSGGIELSDYQTFQSNLNRAVVPAIWDEQGDGYWDELDSTSGTPRWITESGIVPDIYPTSHAIIRSNTVTVGDSLQIESNGLITIDQGANLVVEGIVDANAVEITGEGVLTFKGDFSATSLIVTDGSITVHDTQSPLRVSRLRLGNDSRVRFVVADEAWDTPITMTHPRAVPGFGGDLVLDFDPLRDSKSLVGVELNLFDWGDSRPTTEFEQVVYPDGFEVDLSRLYSSGKVVVISVPEPQGKIVVAVALLCLIVTRILPVGSKKSSES